MKRRSVLVISVSVILLAALCLFFCSKCNTKASGLSFTASLDMIDRAISQGSTRDAVEELKKLEKRAYSSFERLSIYKRYMLLSEKESAERVLKNGLEKLPNNSELRAVYANFLIRQNKIAAAKKHAELLKETKYASLLSECEIFEQLEKNKKENLDAKEEFSAFRFITLYRAAFETSGNSKWIFNAASLLMKNGMYRQAAEFYPQKIESFSEAYFWAGVFFDAGLYSQSLEVCESSASLASAILNQKETVDFLKPQIEVLKSDCYYILGDEEKCHEIRKNFLASEDLTNVPPSVFVNESLLEQKNDNYAEAYKHLECCMNLYPSYFPSLQVYAKYALDINARTESSLAKQLRSSGLRTLEMERFDAAPKISEKDLLLYVDSKRGTYSDPVIDVLEHRIQKIIDLRNDRNKNISGYYKILERYSDVTPKFPEECTDYIVHSLIEKHWEKEAESIFNDYIEERYNVDMMSEPGKFNLWELEVAAWYAAVEGKFEKAQFLLEYIVNSYGGYSEVVNSFAKNESVMRSLVNLAVIYASCDRYQDALEALNIASSRATDSKVKAEILFRIADLQYSLGDDKSAGRALKYCLSLNPEHKDARLLMKKISSKI